MIRTFDFYKDDQGWFVDIPGWEGDKSDLQMIAGADHFLDILAQDNDRISAILADVPLSGAGCLDLVRLGDLESWEYGTGAWYNLTTYKGIDFNFEMWLCDVTKHPMVFGTFPEKIYFIVQ